MKLNEINLYDVGNTIGLTGAVFGDDKVSYLCMFPDQEIQEKMATLEMDLEDWKKFLRQTDLVEVEVLQKTEYGKLAKAIMRKTQRLIEQRVSWAVYKRDGYRCRYCGRDDVPLTVDHLILWEEGGPSIEDNLVACCRKCNKTRGNTHLEDWLKHPYFERVSTGDGGKCPGISPQEQEALKNLFPILDRIPRKHHLRERK
jgi:hypothetical protein